MPRCGQPQRHRAERRVREEPKQSCAIHRRATILRETLKLAIFLYKKQGEGLDCDRRLNIDPHIIVNSLQQDFAFGVDVNCP